MAKIKLVYSDDGATKVLFGEQESEDENFISVVATDGTHFRINKKSIVSIKEVR